MSISLRSAQWLNVFAQPFGDVGKTEFAAIKRAVNEVVSVASIHRYVETVAAQENVSRCKGDPFVAIDKSVVVGERLHQRGRFLNDGVVVASLRAEHGGLDGILVADALATAEFGDQEVVHLVYLGDRQVFRHLFGEACEKFAISRDGLLKRIHYLRPNQVLGRDDVLEIMSKRLFENVSLGLAVLLSDGGELVPKLGIDLGSNFFRFGGRHGTILALSGQI